MTKEAFLNRYDEIGPWRLLAYAEGHVMARRKGAGVATMPIEKWLKLSVKPIADPEVIPLACGYCGEVMPAGASEAEWVEGHRPGRCPSHV